MVKEKKKITRAPIKLMFDIYLYENSTNIILNLCRQ